MAASQGGHEQAAGKSKDGGTTALKETSFDLQPDIS